LITEADTCRKYVLPRLTAARWDEDPHSFTEQKTFTDGRIVVAGKRPKRRAQKRADYLLRFTRDLMIAVVEAKSAYKAAGDGLQQAKEYAEILDLRFAYSTNGKGIIEFDFLTGRESELDTFPSPEELWERLVAAGEIDPATADQYLTPFHHFTGYTPRYYQEIAVNRAVKALLHGDRRVLLTMATGTGKTVVAFQICWKLWNGRWNVTGEYRRPRVLYLADRNILIDDPKDKAFAPFGDARTKIANGEVTKSREIYFAIYQAIAQDELRPGLYKEFEPDFFDLVIVDEAHRGSAKDESSWREILDYFAPAAHLGMTATPLRQDTRDTYRYFGNPVYQYSLKQGIEDGFLAPYKVRRIVTSVDATGWRPEPGERDRLGREIPDNVYGTEDFERILSLRARTEAIARNLADFMRQNDRFAKTIVFCVDQEHADQMRRALNNLNTDLVRKFPDYVVRITSEEGEVGRAHLSDFQEPESQSPAIATTSQLLTTGVDIPTCKNIVIARMINSMPEFKQMIGRGTRVRDDYGKLYFNILDYTGSATTLFADPDFDGEPAFITDEEMDEDGAAVGITDEAVDEGEDDGMPGFPTGQESLADDSEGDVRKFYVDGAEVEIAAELVYELGADGKRLRVVKYADYAGEQVRALSPSAAALRRQWADPTLRSEIITMLEDRGVDFDQLAETMKQADADPFDLICHVAFNSPLRTRRERAAALKNRNGSFLDRYSVEAREVLDELLQKYTDHGTAQFKIPDVLKVPPLSDHGNVAEIAARFGGPEQLRSAITELQNLLYAA
jgi:type I restriction enzyme, R subunit